MSGIDHSTLIQWACAALRSGPKKKHVEDIAAAVLAANPGITVDLPAFRVGLSDALRKDAKSKAGVIQKVAGRKQLYRLRVPRPPKQAPVPKPVSVQSPFLGAAGEFAVMADLLYWGHNVSRMIVDSGIDIVSEKDNKYFRIQVKTSSKRAGGGFSFSIDKRTYTRNNGVETFYVFVMRTDAEWLPMVIPRVVFDQWVKSGDVAGDSSLSVQIMWDATAKQYMLQRRIPLGNYLKNYDQIR